jgi:hypothetical protein
MGDVFVSLYNAVVCEVQMNLDLNWAGTVNKLWNMSQWVTLIMFSAYVFIQFAQLLADSLFLWTQFGPCSSLLQSLQCTVKICDCEGQVFDSVQWLKYWWRWKSWSAATVMCVYWC